MAFEELTLGGGANYLKPAEMSKGQKVEGEFVATSKSPKFDSLNHKIKTAEGEVIINGTGQLNKLLELVRPGDRVQIVYQGVEKIKGGRFPGKEAHQFKVAVERTGAAPTGDLKSQLEQFKKTAK